MRSYLRHTQNEVNSSFARHALAHDVPTCEINCVKNNLEALRLAKGLRLEDIAEIVGVAISTIQRWEKGSMAIPSRRHPSLERAYNCTVSEIFTIDEAPVEVDQDLQNIIEMWPRVAQQNRDKAAQAVALFIDSTIKDRR